MIHQKYAGETRRASKLKGGVIKLNRNSSWIKYYKYQSIYFQQTLQQLNDVCSFKINFEQLIVISKQDFPMKYWCVIFFCYIMFKTYIIYVIISTVIPLHCYNVYLD